jgi:hypothetical protein
VKKKKQAEWKEMKEGEQREQYPKQRTLSEFLG